MSLRVITFCLLFLTGHSASAQTSPTFDEVGRFYQQGFAPENYGGHAQNWDFVQDDRGFLYVGNTYGVLEYDGVEWRLIKLPNHSGVRALAVDTSGRVYVGASGEVGYLAVDSRGHMTYVSLLDHMPQEERGFSSVWNVHALPHGVYFQTDHRLLRWHDGGFEVWSADANFRIAFTIGDALYLTSSESRQVMVLDQGSLRPVDGGEALVDADVLVATPIADGKTLVVTRERGMLSCALGGRTPAPHRLSCEPFGAPWTDLVTELRAYSATAMPSGLTAVGTRFGGLMLFDPRGRLIRVVDEAAGLRNDQVWATFVDRAGGLWLGHNDGISRLEVTPNLSYFDADLGLEGIPIQAARYRGDVYIVTSEGIFGLRRSEGQTPRFEAASDLQDFCWSLVPTERGLLVGCSAGLYHLDSQTWLWNPPTIDVLAMFRSLQHPEHVFLGLRDGLARLTLEDSGWGEIERFDGIQEQIRFITEDAKGQVWLGTPSQGLLRLGPDPSPSHASVRRYGQEDGLPADFLIVRTVGGEIRINSGQYGLFKHVPASDRFVPDRALWHEEGPGVHAMAEDDQGNLWISSTAPSVARPDGKGGYRTALTVMGREPRSDAVNMLAEPGGPVWLITPAGLVRMETEGAEVDAQAPSVWIRSNSTLDGERLDVGAASGSGQVDAAPIWPHAQNSLRFTFASPRFDAPERTVYRTRLEGLDADWSMWSNETRKDYTHLWEGRYTFRVQARDLYGNVSPDATLTFRIEPPWFRSTWAMSLYALALLALGFVVARRIRRELQRERQAAARERQAAERERAVSAKLRQVDKLKDAFLANTSHELRTPLYGMTGLAESLIDGAAGELPTQAKEHLSLLVQSGRRLSVLVDDLLDVSKLDHQSLELALEPIDLHSLTDVVLTLSMPLARDKGLELINRVPTDLPRAHGDTHRIQQVLHNLVGNAIKYSDVGHVVVSAHVDEQRLEVQVGDTGIGIAAEHLDRIFEPFVQVDASLRRRKGGTGLGLAVSRQLIELHGGRLQVDSTLGEGSVFSFTVPIIDELDDLRSTPVPVLSTGKSPSSSETLRLNLASTLSIEPLPSADGKTILVVDDEPVVRQVLTNQLVTAGYRVVTAASGPQALDLLRENLPDLILLDIMMPEMSGYEVCRTLRQEHSVESLPTLFLSAMSRTEDRTAALEQGGNDYLTKPIAKPELLARVALHLAVLDTYRRQLDEIEILKDLLPICMCCKKIRDDDGFWNQMERYIGERFDTTFTHSICPTCATEILGDPRE